MKRSRDANFVSITSNEATLLPEVVDNLQFDEYLHNLCSEIAFTETENPAKRTNFNYHSALSNIETRMTKYGLKVDIDLSNLQVPIQTTVRPPFETFRLFKSPSNFERIIYLSVFTEQHCLQLREHNWNEVGVDFISPQQDRIAIAILTGVAVSSSCPEHTPGYNILTPERVSESVVSPTVEKRKTLPTLSNYWTKWKQVDRTQWDFLKWFENGDETHIGLKKWSKSDRKEDGVDANTYSNLKCIYNKLRDSFADEMLLDVLKVTKFEEHKYKGIKRTLKIDYENDITTEL